MPKSLGTLRYACTPLYASQQQKDGADPDPRDDVFALGVIWYQLSLRDLSKGAPTGLGWDKKLRGLGLSERHIELLGQCMAEDRDDRPKDAQELFERLARLSADQSDGGKKESAPPIGDPTKKTEESPAERVRRLKAEAGKLQDNARVLLQLHDYEAAAALLEGVRPELTPLRDAALFADAVGQRDRLRQLHQQIHQQLSAGKLKDPRLPGLIASFLEIKPNDLSWPAGSRQQLAASSVSNAAPVAKFASGAARCEAGWAEAAARSARHRSRSIKGYGAASIPSRRRNGSK